MFHNAPSAFGASINRTPGRSIIHNDENAMSSHNQLKSHSSKKSQGGGLGGGGGGGALKSLNTNLKPSFANMNAKTPLGKASSTNTRRRALGDISNRKGSGTGTGTGGGDGKNVSIAKQASVKKSSKSQFPASTVKTKTVSFAIHKSSDLSKADLVPKQSVALNQKMKSSLRRRSTAEVEDIELSAGRTWYVSFNGLFALSCLDHSLIKTDHSLCIHSGSKNEHY